MVGADLLAAARAAWALPAGSISAALVSPGWVAVTPELAAELGWKVGTRVPVSLGTRRATLVVGALVDFRRLAPLASRRLAVMDLAQAQGLLGRRGRIHQIDVRAASGARRRGAGRSARGAGRGAGPDRDARAADGGGGGAPRRLPAQPHGAVARLASWWAASSSTPRCGRPSRGAARSSGCCARSARPAARSSASCSGRRRCSARRGPPSGSRSAGSPPAPTWRR